VAAPGLERFDGLPRRALADELLVVEASTRRARNLGLARLDALPAEWGLWIPRCPAIHTLTMRFALDLVWLGRGRRVVRVDRSVAPSRMRICARARSVLEVNAGRADAFLAAGLET
jgi:uncharacterized membrane protein (UPF0127 family)